MSGVPFETPERLSGRPAAAAIEAREQHRAARGAAGEGGGRGAGEGPAGEGGAGPGLGLDPDHDDPSARPFCRQGEATAGGEIVGSEAAFAFDHHPGERGAPRRIERGAQEGRLVPGFDEGQPHGIEAEAGQPLAMEPQGPVAPAAWAEEEQRAFAEAGAGEGEGEGGGAVIPAGVDFVEAAGVQLRNPGGLRR